MTVQNIPIELIDDNPYQPRSSYPTSKIEEIAYSIRQIGLRQVPEGRKVNGHCQLAYGHLRKRAFAKLIKQRPKDACSDTAKHIKDGTMPLDLKELTDKQMVEFAVEENLRRSDITPMDVARTIDLYLSTFDDETETSVATKFNMTQANVSNLRRVLKLPQEVLQKIDDGKINFTMGRELLIFQGKTGNKPEEKWNRKEAGYKKVPKDETWLMLEAVRKIGGQYGSPATVDGIKKAIYDVCRDNFRHLEKLQGYWNDSANPLFDVKAAGCFKCENAVRAYETKSQARHFCCDSKCWDKKQEAHKKKMAVDAKKTMEEDIARRVAEAEKERQEQAAISQEILEPDLPSELAEAAESGVRETVEAKSGEPEIFNLIPEDEREGARARLKNFDSFNNVPCRTCLNVGHCDGTHMFSVSGAGPDEVFSCDDHMGKDEVSKVREKATIKIPTEIKVLAKEKAGSRAEVLDIRELRAGCYGGLKTGYTQLKGRSGAEIDKMDNPDECIKQCTRGFHYAFDSDPGYGYDRKEKPSVYFVCTEPKCVAKKKAAFTRAKNAEGQAKKKAELQAIKQAVDMTVTLNRARMKLIIHAELFRDSYSSYYHPESDKAMAWFCHRLNVDTKDPENPNQSISDKKLIKQRLYDSMDKVSEMELAKLITEYCLMKLLYTGDVKDYKVLTTEPLNWMGIGVNIKKELAKSGEPGTEDELGDTIPEEDDGTQDEEEN